jgi:hypothetical protein
MGIGQAGKGQEKANFFIVYFHPATQTLVSLIEFGLSARVPGKVIVVCPEGFCKRYDVQIVSNRFEIDTVDTMEGPK